MLTWCERPYEDEYLLGYAVRMYGYNGGIESFGRFSLNNFGIGKGRPSKGILRHDNVTELEKSVRGNMLHAAFPDVLTIVFKMLPTGARLPFMPYGAQVRYLEGLLHGKHNFINCTKAAKICRPLRVCPECMKEDRERYGEPYLHTMHQIPMLTACPIHGYVLKDTDIKRPEDIGKAFDTDPGDTEKADPREVMKSVFLYKLYKEPLYTSPTEMVSLIREKTERIKLSYADAYETVRERYVETCSFGSVNDYRQFMYNQINESSFYIEAAETFGILEEIKKGIKQKEEEFISNIGSEYELLSEFGPCVKLRCKNGHEFYASPYAVRMGFGCPICDENLTMEEFADRLLSKVGDGRYHVESVSRNMKDCVVMHDTCGKARTGLLDIIFGEKKCKCEVTASLDDYQRMIDPEKKEFICERFLEDPSGRKMRVRHKKCGCCFDIKPVYFLASPGCRICDLIDRSIRELTGDEYVRISPYKGYRRKIKILHRTCATVFEMTPAAFRNGYRCPLCSRNSIPEDYVRDSVRRCTDGLYRIPDICRDSVRIICPDGSIMKKTRSFVIQELMRPTDSELFRYRFGKPDPLISDRYRVFMKAMKTCNNGGEWKAEDIPGISNPTRRSICRWLHDNGYLKRIGKGIYVPGERCYKEKEN